ncbi:uncharacterized protein LOC114366550 [Ostrinia furnacalis]|uniref:uncharacterized protein LOC114366550 n=1 Tax=Ostrinia furnacalis TaxID=93504 RepID=UPI00103FD7E0|nr:uncharacterized protein LOC114366550 [Ostrinia furnacalis]
MNVINEISDEEFVPFLQSLGVETYKKSFEWMLNDADFSGVLRWLYDNLDHNNALSAREEYRYTEIEKHGQLLSLEDLEKAIDNLQNEYEGLCIPGDKETQEDVKMDLSMQKERLIMLEKQEEVLNDLLKQNELIKEELNLEVTKLHSAQQQCTEDESTAADECLQLAEEVETITEDVVDVVADALDLYSNCHADKEMSRKFYTFGPFESYRQSQTLFRSHFDLFTTRKFGNRQKDNVTDEDLRLALIEAKSLEERLIDATLAYIESKAELSGEQAKLALVSNYNNVHPSQLAECLIEAQGSVELLEQEEAILDQQIQDSVKDLVDSRTRLAVETTARSALAVREQMHRDISHLLATTQQALTLDRILYCAFRHELRTLEQVLQFAAHLRLYCSAEKDAVCSRIESMHQICSEQDQCLQKVQSSDVLTEALCKMLGAPHTSDAAVLVKVYTDVISGVDELRDDIAEAFRNKEAGIDEFSKSCVPLRNYIWDGCTRQPNCWDRSASALSHSLKHEMGLVDKKVLDASSLFTAVKNGDKNNLRKLWQWFLTDHNQLSSVIKHVQAKGMVF